MATDILRWPVDFIIGEQGTSMDNTPQFKQVIPLLKQRHALDGETATDMEVVLDARRRFLLIQKVRVTTPTAVRNVKGSGPSLADRHWNSANVLWKSGRGTQVHYIWAPVESTG